MRNCSARMPSVARKWLLLIARLRLWLRLANEPDRREDAALPPARFHQHHRVVAPRGNRFHVLEIGRNVTLAKRIQSPRRDAAIPLQDHTVIIASGNRHHVA